MIKKHLATSLTLLLTLVMLLSIIGSAAARENKVVAERNEPAASSQGQGSTDPAEMEAFMDDLLQKQLEENHIAGAAVAVVKDGKLFFTEGYGHVDLQNNIAVDPEQTLFKVGSVTKLFTWTAVMQLAEQGKLNLDVNVSAYLDFRVPDTYPQPITLKHLMSHTAGFEDLHADMVTLKEKDIVPEGKWLASHMPARVVPPGEVAAYSNYGAALAGYIVARASGESYSQYVQEHILEPLGMHNSTAQLVTPPAFSARESVGYMYTDGGFQVFPRLLSHEDLFPAGVMRSTVMDMARFMIAHLQVLAVLHFDPETKEIMAISAWNASDWYLNI